VYIVFIPMTRTHPRSFSITYSWLGWEKPNSPGQDRIFNFKFTPAERQYLDRTELKDVLKKLSLKGWRSLPLQ
jgi:hypothetical protein